MPRYAKRWQEARDKERDEHIARVASQASSARTLEQMEEYARQRHLEIEAASAEFERALGGVEAKIVELATAVERVDVENTRMHGEIWRAIGGHHPLAGSPEKPDLP